MSQTFTSEFHAEFEAERGRWLRRRALWYLGVSLVFSAVSLIAVLFSGVITKGQIGLSQQTVMFFGQLVGVAVYVWAFLHIRRRLMTRDQTVRFIYWIIVGVTLYSIFLNPIVQLSFSDSNQIKTLQTATGEINSGDTRLTPRTLAILVGGGGLNSIFVAHFFAALFIPWTPREAIRPLIPLTVVVAAALIILLAMGAGWIAVLMLCLLPLMGVPGWLICYWRHGRFRDRFMTRAIRGRYYDMKRELVDARRIHESLFPKTHLEGPVSFDYRYEPMRQIGGDFLYRRFGPSPHGDQPRLSVVIIDVTGHGIPAALTVNRLHGEIERLFAENHDVTPGQMLDALNRYVHLTLAEHSVYVTALCIRIDPNMGMEGALEFASGGHPPAFVRTVDGRVEQLNSTAFVLGAVPTEAFDSGQITVRFGPGDTLIAYTDGAIEARDQKGRMIRVEGMLGLVASESTWANGSAAQEILNAVDRHRYGPIADDTLIVELCRVLRSAGAAPTQPKTASVQARAR